MSNKSIEKILEEEYIIKSIASFEGADRYISEKIRKTIDVVSFQVECIIKTPLPENEKEEVLSDLGDFIPTNLAANQVFFNIVNDFIIEKAKSFHSEIDNTKKRSDKLSENIIITESMDSKIEKIHYYLDIIKKDIIIIEEYISDIIGMREILCPKVLNVAKRQLFRINRWLEKNVIEIDLAIKSITFIIIGIEQEKTNVNMSDTQRLSIYNNEGTFISDEFIANIKSLLSEFERQAEDYEKHINHVLELKMIEEENDNNIVIENADNIRETDLMLAIISEYSDTKSTSIINTINYIISDITDIIESSIPHNDKMKKFAKPLEGDLYNLNIFEGNTKAIKLLNELINIRIDEYIIESDTEITMSHTIPRSCHLDVMKQLHVIVNKTLGEKKDDDVKKTIIKRKCDQFIGKLDEIILELYTLISERGNYTFFKNTRIKYILKDLKIENGLHDDFMKVVDYYYKDGCSTTNIEAQKRERPLTILEEAYDDLKVTLADFPVGKLKIVEKFIKFVQINLPVKIHQDIIDNISIEKNKSLSNSGVKGIVKRMSQGSMVGSVPTSTPYDTIFNSSKKRITQNKPVTILGMKKDKDSVEDKRMNEVIQYFFTGFPHVRSLQKQLRPFLESYYQYEMQRALKNYDMATNIFEEVKKEN